MEFRYNIPRRTVCANDNFLRRANVTIASLREGGGPRSGGRSPRNNIFQRNNISLNRTYRALLPSFADLSENIINLKFTQMPPSSRRKALLTRPLGLSNEVFFGNFVTDSRGRLSLQTDRPQTSHANDNFLRRASIKLAFPGGGRGTTQWWMRRH